MPSHVCALVHMGAIGPGAQTQHLHSLWSFPPYPKHEFNLLTITLFPEYPSYPCGIYCYLKSKPQKGIALSVHILCKLFWWALYCLGPSVLITFSLLNFKLLHEF